MKTLRFNHVVMIILLSLAVVFFVLQFIIFHNAEESGFLFFQDLMFLPLHILLVTFILDRILLSREKQERLQQIHIVISAFFSEIGTDALREVGAAIADRQQIAEKLDMKPDWGAKAFEKAADALKGHTFHRGARCAHAEYATRKNYRRKRRTCCRCSPIPTLLEHDTFTDMLWALYHLTDELENRKEFSTLPESDIAHMAGDITRAIRYARPSVAEPYEVPEGAVPVPVVHRDTEEPVRR